MDNKDDKLEYQSEWKHGEGVERSVVRIGEDCLEWSKTGPYKVGEQTAEQFCRDEANKIRRGRIMGMTTQTAELRAEDNLHEVGSPEWHEHEKVYGDADKVGCHEVDPLETGKRLKELESKVTALDAEVVKNRIEQDRSDLEWQKMLGDEALKNDGLPAGSSWIFKRVLGRLKGLEDQVESLQNTAGRHDPNLRLDAIERKVEFHGKMAEEFAEDGKSQTEFDDEVLVRLDAIKERFENVERDVSSVQARQSWVDREFEELKERVKGFDADTWGKDVCRDLKKEVDSLREDTCDGLNRIMAEAKKEVDSLRKDKVNVLLSKVDALEADNARLWGWKKDVESFNEKLERHLYYHKVQIAFMCDHFKIRNFLADLNAGKWLGPELKQDKEEENV